MRLLLAEDDPLLADALCAQLETAGFTVSHAANGAVAQYLLQTQSFDIAILDIGLPLIDGLSVLRALRQRELDLPVLVLTARDALDDRVEGLQSGADDYVTKPFDWPELHARLQALLRRSARSRQATTVERWAALTVDSARRRAWIDDRPIELSGREWALLTLLLDHRQQVLTKEIIQRAWGSDAGESVGNTVEVYIHRLRRKLEGSGLGIRTVRGLGYLLEPVQSES